MIHRLRKRTHFCMLRRARMHAEKISSSQLASQVPFWHTFCRAGGRISFVFSAPDTSTTTVSGRPALIPPPKMPIGLQMFKIVAPPPPPYIMWDCIKIPATHMLCLKPPCNEHNNTSKSEWAVWRQQSSNCTEIQRGGPFIPPQCMFLVSPQRQCPGLILLCLNYCSLLLNIRCTAKTDGKIPVSPRPPLS